MLTQDSAVIALEAYAADCRLFGFVDPGEGRLTDFLNASPELRIHDARLESLADGHIVQTPELMLARDELCAVVAGEPRGDASRRVRTHAHRFVVDLGPYAITGLVHSTSASDPLGAVLRRAAWVPLTEVTITYRRGQDAVVEELETLLVNRNLTSLFRAVEDRFLIPHAREVADIPEMPGLLDSRPEIDEETPALPQSGARRAGWQPRVAAIEASRVPAAAAALSEDAQAVPQPPEKKVAEVAPRLLSRLGRALRPAAQPSGKRVRETTPAPAATPVAKKAIPGRSSLDSAPVTEEAISATQSPPDDTAPPAVPPAAAMGAEELIPAPSPAAVPPSPAAAMLSPEAVMPIAEDSTPAPLPRVAAPKVKQVPKPRHATRAVVDVVPALAAMPATSPGPAGKLAGSSQRGSTRAKPARPAAGRAPVRRSPARRRTRAKAQSAALPSAFCPYCALVLQPAPVASRRCPRCRQRIIVKRVDGQPIYLTEAAVQVFESERERITTSGRMARERERWLKLAASAGAPTDRQARLAASTLSEKVVEGARTLYLSTVDRAFKAAKRDHQWETASRVRRDQATALYRVEGSPVPPPDDLVDLYREGVAAELRGIAEISRDAELVSATCCDICRADDRKIFRIANQLKVPRLPHQGCPKGLCRCGWDLAARDRSTMRRYLRRRPGTETRTTPDEPAPTT